MSVASGAMPSHRAAMTRLAHHPGLPVLREQPELLGEVDGDRRLSHSRDCTCAASRPLPHSGHRPGVARSSQPHVVQVVSCSIASAVHETSENSEA